MAVSGVGSEAVWLLILQHLQSSAQLAPGVTRALADELLRLNLIASASDGPAGLLGIFCREFALGFEPCSAPSGTSFSRLIPMLPPVAVVLRALVIRALPLLPRLSLHYRESPRHSKHSKSLLRRWIMAGPAAATRQRVQEPACRHPEELPQPVFSKGMVGLCVDYRSFTACSGCCSSCMGAACLMCCRPGLLQCSLLRGICTKLLQCHGAQHMLTTHSKSVVLLQSLLEPCVVSTAPPWKQLPSRERPQVPIGGMNLLRRETGRPSGAAPLLLG